MTRVVIVGVLAFAGGALAGGLFVRWYVQAHAGELAAGAVAGKLGLGSGGTAILSGIGDELDKLRAAA